MDHLTNDNQNNIPLVSPKSLKQWILEYALGDTGNDLLYVHLMEVDIIHYVGMPILRLS